MATESPAPQERGGKFPANGSTISNYPDNQNTFPFEEVRLEIV
jgi:hypothetical protein